MPSPHRPQQISPFAEACLAAVAAHDCGRYLSLGGAFGLAHYFEYRTTHDLDAWWVEPVPREAREQVLQVLTGALHAFGEVRRREWGDVVSLDLRQQNKVVFSFQIARRTAELHPAEPGPWPGGVRVDSFADLVASKMVALVERGAPRDFRDIYTLCTAGQTTPPQCWAWWQQRENAVNRAPDRQRADLAIRTHLKRIEQARPIADIGDEGERAASAQLRAWFKEEFLA